MPTHQPDDSGAALDASNPGFEPTDAMKNRNRRFGMIFIGVIAFLVALTVVTRVILSS